MGEGVSCRHYLWANLRNSEGIHLVLIQCFTNMVGVDDLTISNLIFFQAADGTRHLFKSKRFTHVLGNSRRISPMR